MNFSEKALLAEWLGLFWGIPLILLTRIYPFNLLWLLFAATFICGFYLVRNKNFDNRRLGGWSKMRLVWKGMLVRGLLCAGLLLAINLRQPLKIEHYCRIC